MLKTFLNKKNIARFFYFSFWIAYFSAFWFRAIEFDADGNLTVFHLGMWGDWSSHFTMGSAMAYRKLFLQVNPFLITAQFNYPFISNLLSALLIRIGVPFFNAFLVPSFLFSLLVIFAIYFFYAQFFKSEKVAIVSSMLFLLNGGWGFKYYLNDIADAKNLLNALIYPLNKYTDWPDKNLFCTNVIDTMIIPQRAFVLGFPLAVLLLTIFLKPEWRSNLKILILGSITLGLMPIIHTHSFMCASIILICWFLIELKANQAEFLSTWKKSWGLFGFMSIIISTSLIFLFLYSKKILGDFFHWEPGWYAHENNINWFKFWFLNWGLMPMVALVGWRYFYLREQAAKTSINRAWLLTPFFVLFILLNLFLFQPWIWDNTKILVWTSLGFSGVTGYLIVNLWQENETLTYFSRMGRNLSFVKRSFCLTLFFLLTFAGGLDALRLQSHDRNICGWYSEEEFGLTEWVKTHTDVKSVWLTSNRHNHWLYNLTGRQALMAYEGWIWTYGLRSDEMHAAVYAMFKHPDDLELFKKYRVDYAVVGPSEIELFDANKQEFDRLFEVTYKTDTTTIYKISTKISG